MTGLCLRLSKPSTTQKRPTFQSSLPSTRLINQVPTQNVLSVNWQNMVLCQLPGVEILNLLKSQLNSTKHRRIVETVLLVAEIQELKADPTVRAIGTVIEARLIKEKVRLQPFLFNKVPWMFKTQSLSEIPSVVSVLWPMTLVVVLRLQDHQHQFQSQVWTKRQWRVTTLPFTKMKKNLRVQLVKNVPNVLLWTTSSNQRVSLENLFDTLKLVNSNLLTLSSRPMYKVLLKPFLPHFKRLTWKVSKLPSFTQRSVPSTNLTWPLRKLQMPLSLVSTYALHHKLVNKLKLMMWNPSPQHYLQGYRRDGRSHERMLDPEFEEKSYRWSNYPWNLQRCLKWNYRWIHGYQW